MASNHAESKRRPMPIALPDVQYPATATPGPDAAILAAQAKDNEGRKQLDNGVLQGTAARLFRSKSNKATADTGDNSTLAATRRHRPTQSNSNVSHSGNRLEQEIGANEDARTGRAKLEAEKERKYFKMMGQIPDTPTDGIEAPEPDTHYQVQDLRPRVSTVSKTSTTEGAKSPKKKFFGVSLPSFKTSANPTPPPMPEKVVKILGSSPPPAKVRNKFPQTHRSLPSATGARSKTPKALPTDAYRQHAQHYRSHHRRPLIHAGDITNTRKRLSGGKPPSSGNVAAERPVKAPYVRSSSSESMLAPTPPQKDTPPSRGGYASAVEQISNMVTTVPKEPELQREDVVDKGMRMHIPTMFALDPNFQIDAGDSPTKYHRYGAEEYAKIVNREPIKSSRAAVSRTSSVFHTERSQTRSASGQTGDDGSNNGSTKIEPLEVPPSDTSQNSANRLLFNFQSDVVPDPVYLPATVYIPNSHLAGAAENQMTTDYLLFSAPRSGEMTNSSSVSCRGPIYTPVEEDPHGNSSDSPAAIAAQPAAQSKGVSPSRTEHHTGPNVAHHAKQESRVSNPYFSHPNMNSQGHQPGRQSSQLIDMLSGVSPSKIDFLEYQPASAVPSPLHHHTIQQPRQVTAMAGGAYAKLMANAINVNKTQANDCSVADMEDRLAGQIHPALREQSGFTVTRSTKTKIKPVANGQDASLPNSNHSSKEKFELTKQRMDEHFEMTNEDVNSTARALYDQITTSNERNKEAFYDEAQRSASLKNRVSVLEDRLESRVAVLEKRLEEEVAGLGQQWEDEIASFVDRVEGRVEDHVADFGQRIEDHVTGFQNRVTDFGDRVENHVENLYAGFEDQVSGLGKRLDNQAAGLERIEKRVAGFGVHLENVSGQVKTIRADNQSDSKKLDAQSASMDKLTMMMEQLFDYVKSEVAESLHGHILKCAMMEHDIKGLHLAMQDLQQTIERKTPHSGKYSHSTSSSPFKLSQPPRIGYNDYGTASAGSNTFQYESMPGFSANNFVNNVENPFGPYQGSK